MSKLEKVHYIASTTFTIPEKYKDLKAIGKGSYGVVCSALDAIQGKTVAIKKITPMAKHTIDAKHVLREIRLMRYMGKHENIVSLEDLIIRDAADELYIVMELMDSDLHRVLQSQQILTDSHYRHFMHQLLCGLKYLHDNHIIHRDLKPGNLLVTRDCRLRITDFGLAREKATTTTTTGNEQGSGQEPIDEPMTEHVVTRWYRPPELMLCPGKNFIEQLTLIFDVIGAPRPSDVAHIKNSQAVKFLDSQTKKQKVPFEKIFPNAPDDAFYLLENLLIFSPEKRISVDEALRSSFFDPIAAAPLTNVSLTFPEVSPNFEFRFERQNLTKFQLKQLIHNEVTTFRQEKVTVLTSSTGTTTAASSRRPSMESQSASSSISDQPRKSTKNIGMRSNNSNSNTTTSSHRGATTIKGGSSQSHYQSEDEKENNEEDDDDNDANVGRGRQDRLRESTKKEAVGIAEEMKAKNKSNDRHSSNNSTSSGGSSRGPLPRQRATSTGRSTVTVRSGSGGGGGAGGSKDTVTAKKAIPDRTSINLTGRASISKETAVTNGTNSTTTNTKTVNQLSYSTNNNNNQMGLSSSRLADNKIDLSNNSERNDTSEISNISEKFKNASIVPSSGATAKATNEFASELLPPYSRAKQYDLEEEEEEDGKNDDENDSDDDDDSEVLTARVLVAPNPTLSSPGSPNKKPRNRIISSQGLTSRIDELHRNNINAMEDKIADDDISTILVTPDLPTYSSISNCKRVMPSPSRTNKEAIELFDNGEAKAMACLSPATKKPMNISQVRDETELRVSKNKLFEDTVNTNHNITNNIRYNHHDADTDTDEDNDNDREIELLRKKLARLENSHLRDQSDSSEEEEDKDPTDSYYRTGKTRKGSGSGTQLATGRNSSSLKSSGTTNNNSRKNISNSNYNNLYGSINYNNTINNSSGSGNGKGNSRNENLPIESKVASSSRQNLHDTTNDHQNQNQNKDNSHIKNTLRNVEPVRSGSNGRGTKSATKLTVPSSPKFSQMSWQRKGGDGGISKRPEIPAQTQNGVGRGGTYYLQQQLLQQQQLYQQQQQQRSLSVTRMGRDEPYRSEKGESSVPGNVGGGGKPSSSSVATTVTDQSNSSQAQIYPKYTVPPSNTLPHEMRASSALRNSGVGAGVGGMGLGDSVKIPNMDAKEEQLKRRWEILELERQMKWEKDRLQALAQSRRVSLNPSTAIGGGGGNNNSSSNTNNASRPRSGSTGRTGKR